MELTNFSNIKLNSNMIFMRVVLVIFALSITFLASAQNEWKSMKRMPSEAQGRHHPITFSLDGQGYVMGGSGQNDDLKDMYRYDPEEDTWTKLDDFAGTARGFSISGVASGKAYVGFGRGQEPGEPVVYYNDLWRYDANDESWTQLADCPCDGRSHPAFVTTDTKIFVGLGNSVIGNYNYNDWWEYDIASDSWSQKPNFPSTRRHHPYFFEIDGLAYVAFGHGDIIYNDLYVYNPDTEEWKFLGFLPDQARVAGTQFSHNGKGYVLSGDGDTHDNLPTGEFWCYDPGSNEWEKLQSHPGPGRWAPGSFLIDDTIYFTGGEDGFLYKDLLAFDLSQVDVSTSDLRNQSLKLYPNPTNDGIIHLDSEDPIRKIELFKTDGQLVQNLSLTNDSSLDLSHLDNGTYYLRISRQDGNELLKPFQIAK